VVHSQVGHFPDQRVRVTLHGLAQARKDFLAAEFAQSHDGAAPDSRIAIVSQNVTQRRDSQESGWANVSQGKGGHFADLNVVVCQGHDQCQNAPPRFFPQLTQTRSRLESHVRIGVSQSTRQTSDNQVTAIGMFPVHAPSLSSSILPGV
jgi:hypothetical protein